MDGGFRILLFYMPFCYSFKKRNVFLLKGTDMQWNKMLWWMGAVLLLACLLLSKRSMSQDEKAAETKPAERMYLTVVEKSLS